MTNKTRVAGIYHMYQDLLRSLFALKFYTSVNAPTRAKMLTDDEWNQVAQFTGLMDDPASLCFISQKDCVGTESEMILELAYVLFRLKYKKLIIDTYQYEPWSAKTVYDKLPRVKHRRDNNIADDEP